MQKVFPFLWYNTQAEEAMKFYLSVFKNSKAGEVKYWGPGSPYPAGSVMSASFTIEGQEILAFNGGPHYKLNPSFSFFVNCKTQEEIDDLWTKLTSDGGRESQCGWLEDKFGLSWQIVPEKLLDMVTDPNPAKAEATMKAMMTMVKLDIKALQKAYDNA